jgi:7-cyano-7-deazaguanine synthase
MTKITDRAVVLLSGGQDSTTCLGWAKRRFIDVFALSINYGQRHHSELIAAEEIAKMFSVPLTQLQFPALGSLGGSALVSTDKNIAPDGGYADAEAPNGLPTSFVPGRNLLLLGLAAAHAVQMQASNIVTGTCQSDYSGYPDCRRVFIDAAQQAITLAMPSSAGPFEVHTPLMYRSKAEAVLMAHDDPTTWRALARSVTCYYGNRPGCGKCPACDLRAKGFATAGFSDPAMQQSPDY